MTVYVLTYPRAKQAEPGETIELHAGQSCWAHPEEGITAPPPSRTEMIHDNSIAYSVTIGMCVECRIKSWKMKTLQSVQ